MGVSEFASVPESESDSVYRRLTQVILRHMEALKRSTDGKELYSLIARVLRKYGQRGAIDSDCLVELHHQLDAYAHDAVARTTSRTKARMLQLHIAPYVPGAEPTDVAVADAPPTWNATEMPYQSLSSVQPINIDPTPSVNAISESGPALADEARQRFRTMQRPDQDAWRAVYDFIKDFSELKGLWAKNLDELTQEKQRLEQKLLDTEQQLKNIQSHYESLRTDLEAVRAPSKRKSKKKNTKAARPSRTAGSRLVPPEIFMQQINAELKRAKRSGASMALGLLGIDSLQATAKHQGAGATAAIIGCYERRILPGFRAYDVIGRQGHDVFAVLFPDTPQDGAVRAMEKAQRRSTDTHVNLNGQRFALPGFYGVLTLPTPGEEPESWLQRAEAALAAARERDGERLIVA